MSDEYNEELEFTEETENEIQDDTENAELEILQSRIELLAKDNAELIEENLSLRAKNEALLQARAALPEFSAATSSYSDKYFGIREAFRNTSGKRIKV